MRTICFGQSVENLRQETRLAPSTTHGALVRQVVDRRLCHELQSQILRQPQRRGLDDDRFRRIDSYPSEFFGAATQVSDASCSR